MATSVDASSANVKAQITCPKEVLKAFLKRNAAEGYWRANGIAPPSMKGFRNGSPLAAQKAIANLVEQLYRYPIDPDAFIFYRHLWAWIVDKLTDKAWSSPTALEFHDSASSRALLERLLVGSKSISREEIEEILRVGPLSIDDCKELLAQFPLTETIVAQRSLDEVRTGRLR